MDGLTLRQCSGSSRSMAPSKVLSTSLTAKDKWLFEPPAFPLDMDDVGIIIKTGFSTQERLRARLDAFEDAHLQGGIILVGDYSTAPGAHFNHRGQELPVYNPLAVMIESGSLSSKTRCPAVTILLQPYSCYIQWETKNWRRKLERCMGGS